MNTIVKATSKVSVFAVLMLSLQAHAIFDPNWERPIESAKMEILETRRGFDLVDNLEVVVRKRDGAMNVTSLVINYEQGMGEMLPAFQNISEEYFVEESGIYKDDCGSVYYSARKSQGEGRQVGARSSVTLIDHRHRICDDVVTHLFELDMRKGYGWCGTMDATLKAGGNPEALYSAYIK